METPIICTRLNRWDLLRNELSNAYAMSFSMEDLQIFLIGGNFFTGLSDRWEDCRAMRRDAPKNPGTAIALSPVGTAKRGGP
ncbi:MAG TPA: hypothetical protein VF130_04810 [Candidatus Binatia bacterium]